MSTAPLTGPIKPTIQSLGDNYAAPDWFRDAKFGIYMHWGIYSVIGRGEWYARYMYEVGHEDNLYHIETYGHPSKFGYKDFIPMWQAEKFDPDAMLDAIANAGAKYFCPCAVHHDNFDLWDSKHHAWNAAKMGPKQDIIGLLRDATRRAGLKWGVTTHLARSYSWFNVSHNSDAGGAYDGNDPAYEAFYHPSSGEDQSSWHPANPPAAWRDQWRARMYDLIDNYEPDLLYFDGALPFRGDDEFQSGMDVLAHYYNRSIERHGKLDSIMFIKDIDEFMGSHSHGLYCNNVASLDLEHHGANRLLYRPWQTDYSILKYGWSYNPTAEMYSAEEMIWLMADIVSKNGTMLLNIPPAPSGELEQRVIERLAEIGEWLGVNGEAIYGSRPFAAYGQDADVRYTTQGDVLYAIVRELPADGKLVLRALGSDVDLCAEDALMPAGMRQTAAVQRVMLLATGESLGFEQAASRLTITGPSERPAGICDAIVFKIQCDRPMKPSWIP
jgi:alpha-L-fucosidase